MPSNTAVAIDTDRNSDRDTASPPPEEDELTPRVLAKMGRFVCLILFLLMLSLTLPFIEAMWIAFSLTQVARWLGRRMHMRMLPPALSHSGIWTRRRVKRYHRLNSKGESRYFMLSDHHSPSICRQGELNEVLNWLFDDSPAIRPWVRNIHRKDVPAVAEKVCRLFFAFG
jgi:hypothetical protein